MIKMITPIGILLTVALMVIYSFCAFRIGFIERSWALTVAGGVAVVASYGAAMLRPWSQYLVYLLAIGFTAKLAHSIYSGVVAGYFALQFSSISEALTSIVPSMAMAMISCVCCLLVFRHFRRVRKIDTGSIAPAGPDQTRELQK